MVPYSLKDILITSFCSIILFAILISFNLSKYTTDYTLLLASLIAVILASNSVRKKTFLSLKLNLNRVDYKGLFLCALLFIILFLVSDSRDSARLNDYSIGLFLRAVLLSPLCEEIFFRAIIFGYLMNKTGSLIVSSIFTSIVFSCAHDLEIFYYAFFISFLLCMTRHYSMSILPCVVFHSLHNMLILIARYV